MGSGFYPKMKRPRLRDEIYLCLLIQSVAAKISCSKPERSDVNCDQTCNSVVSCPDKKYIDEREEGNQFAEGDCCGSAPWEVAKCFRFDWLVTGGLSTARITEEDDYEEDYEDYDDHDPDYDGEDQYEYDYDYLNFTSDWGAQSDTDSTAQPFPDSNRCFTELAEYEKDKKLLRAA